MTSNIVKTCIKSKYGKDRMPTTSLERLSLQERLQEKQLDYKLRSRKQNYRRNRTELGSLRVNIFPKLFNFQKTQPFLLGR